MQRIATFEPDIIKHFVRDVDDTLVRNSMKIKNQVWEEIFPDRLEEIRLVNRMFDKDGPFPNGSYHQGDRYERVAYMLGKWEPNDKYYRKDAKVVELVDKFNTKVKNKIKAMGVHADDMLSLQEIKKKFPVAQFYVVSNVPEEVLINDLSKYGILDMFVKAIGTPTSKVEALEKIIKEHKCKHENVIMIGDGNNDYQAALEVGTQFVGIRAGKNSIWDSSATTCNHLADLSNLFKK